MHMHWDFDVSKLRASSTRQASNAEQVHWFVVFLKQKSKRAVIYLTHTYTTENRYQIVFVCNMNTLIGFETLLNITSKTNIPTEKMSQSRQPSHMYSHIQITSCSMRGAFNIFNSPHVLSIKTSAF